jgi:CRP/FNR family transcriptional regulator, anaerobic regulatory protein
MRSPVTFIKTIKEQQQFEQLLALYGAQKTIPKGKQMVSEGEKSNFFFYIIEGGFKSYITKGDREYILGFSFADDVDACPYALFGGHANTYTLEAFMDSEIIKIRKTDLDNFCRANEGFENFVQKSLIDYIGLVEVTLFDLISKTAEERYIDLRKNFQSQIEKISLSDIAKYLGVTQERLSRIRKKIK